MLKTLTYRLLTRACAHRSSQKCYYSTILKPGDKLSLNNTEFLADEWTNVSPSITSKLNRNLIHQKYHPLAHLTNQIKHFFYTKFTNRAGNPIFSIFDNISPVVSIEQNFDSLLVPKNHVSRSKSDCYYINKSHLLRSHTSAHQSELIRAGLNSFLVFGDVYRRDEIDNKHYPVFHQCEGVRLFNKHELFSRQSNVDDLHLFEKEATSRNELKQAEHSMEAAKLVEHDLKSVLTNLTKHIFGTNCE